MADLNAETTGADLGPNSLRLSSALRHLVELAGGGPERELIDVVLQAAAIWYDLDVRGYRRNLEGRFVLETWLPGADLKSAPRDFSGFAIVSGSEVVRISSLAEQEQLGWHGLPGDLLMLPIPSGTQAQPRWVLVTSNKFEAPVDPCLLMLCQILGALLQQSAAKQVEEVQQRLLRRLVQSDASLEGVAEAGLKDLVEAVNAAQARLVVRTAGETQARALASVGTDWAATPLPALESGQSIVSARRIAIWLTLGPGVVAVFELVPPAGQEFTDRQGTLVEAGLIVFGVWLSGRLKGLGSGRAPSVPRPTTDFESQIADEVRLATRLNVPAGLLVVDVPQASPQAVRRTGAPALEDVSRQIRSSDLAGRLEGGHLGVLLLQADDEGLTAAGDRIRKRLDEVARRAGLPPAMLGLAAFAHDGEPVSAVVTRALADAVRTEPNL